LESASQTDGHPHRRRLPAAVGTKEPGDLARRDREAQAVDADDRAVPFPQIAGFDHVEIPAGGADTIDSGGCDATRSARLPDAAQHLALHHQ
jgi:hypothetical protein